MVKRLRRFFLNPVIISLLINKHYVQPQTPFFSAACLGEIPTSLGYITYITSCKISVHIFQVIKESTIDWFSFAVSLLCFQFLQVGFKSCFNRNRGFFRLMLSYFFLNFSLNAFSKSFVFLTVYKSSQLPNSYS